MLAEDRRQKILVLKQLACNTEMAGNVNRDMNLSGKIKTTCLPRSSKFSREAGGVRRALQRAAFCQL